MAKKNIATFLGPQKGLSIVGDHCYAFTGVVETTAAFQTFLDFQSPGKRYIKAHLDVLWGEFSGDSIEWNLLMNGVEVMDALNTHTANYYFPITHTDFIIPPSTHVVWRIINNSGSTGRNVSAVLRGRVYDA